MRYWLHLVLALTMLLASPAMASSGHAFMHDCSQHSAHHHIDTSHNKAAPASKLDKHGQPSVCCQTSVHAMPTDMKFASPPFLSNVAYAPITLSLLAFAAMPASPPPKISL